MACFYPLSAFQTDDGKVTFVERGRIRRPLTLPCGQCVGCRLDRVKDWAIRCVHEASLFDHSSFVTLTYSDENCPVGLKYSDFQKFMKRLRKAKGPSRFFMCGEYGELGDRPHFHACLFGTHFADRVVHSVSGDTNLYRSAELERLWPLGYSTIGDVTFDSAAYCASYVMKKLNGDKAKGHYERVLLGSGEIVDVAPEFCRMSLKPGVGARWFDKYHTDVFGEEKDGVFIYERKQKPPRYYTKLLERLDNDLHAHVSMRRSASVTEAMREDTTPERLLVRERVTKARLSQKQRKL